jgi:surface polysaccharide O-acyltransferase-like enzyme
MVWSGFALLFYGAILLLVYAHHNWVADFRSPPLWWQTAYGLCFAMFCAAMTFALPAISLRFARSRAWLLDAMRSPAYGIYLLHFLPLMWLQYLVYAPAFPAFVKFVIVFTGTLSVSWALAVLLRRIPVVARMI